MIKDYDFIVIGGGSGGYAAARTAREVTDSVAIVDGAKELGGLCILRGCMPSKTLLYSAEVLHQAKRGRTFGLDIPQAAADMPAVARRKKEIIGEFADYRRKSLESERFDLFRSFAHFVDHDVIELVDGSRLRGRKFVLATGSVVNCPPVPGLADIPAWDSDDVLNLDSVPESVIVLGGGTVGCELAQFLSRIGTKVTMIQRSPHILSDLSPDLAEVVEKTFLEEEIELFTGTSIQGLSQTDDEIEACFTCRGKETRIRAKHCFNALGRRPDTSALRLETAGVRTNPNGQIITNRFQQTSNPNIYAAGDCCSHVEIVHIAVQQGEIATGHALGHEVEPLHYEDLLLVIFTDPQVATAGLSEEKIREKGVDFLTAQYPFDDHGKSILMEAKHGFVRVFAEAKSGRILGAEIAGKDAGELIHCFSVALTMKATVFDLLRTPWYHPTLSEIFTYPLEDIADAIKERRTTAASAG